MINGPHKPGEAFVAHLLADGEILAGMIPVMINGALDQISVDAGNRFAVDDRVFLQFGRGQRIQPRICRGGDRFLCR